MICEDCNCKMYFSGDKEFTTVRCPVCDRLYYFVDRSILKMVLKKENVSEIVKAINHWKDTVGEVDLPQKPFGWKDVTKENKEWEEFVEMASK